MLGAPVQGVSEIVPGMNWVDVGAALGFIGCGSGRSRLRPIRGRNAIDEDLARLWGVGAGCPRKIAVFVNRKAPFGLGKGRFPFELYLTRHYYSFREGSTAGVDGAGGGRPGLAASREV